MNKLNFNEISLKHKVILSELRVDNIKTKKQNWNVTSKEALSSIVSEHFIRSQLARRKGDQIPSAVGKTLY